MEYDTIADLHQQHPWVKMRARLQQTTLRHRTWSEYFGGSECTGGTEAQLCRADYERHLGRLERVAAATSVPTAPPQIGDWVHQRTVVVNVGVVQHGIS